SGSLEADRQRSIRFAISLRSEYPRSSMVSQAIPLGLRLGLRHLSNLARGSAHPDHAAASATPARQVDARARGFQQSALCQGARARHAQERHGDADDKHRLLGELRLYVRNGGTDRLNLFTLTKGLRRSRAPALRLIRQSAGKT